MRYGLLGEHLGHSFSKEIHEKLGRYPYELIEIAPDELGGFMRSKAFAGLNVTIPYKQAVIPYLDALSDRAQAIGAVNTVVNRGGKLYGDNTDFGGLEALLRRMGLELGGKTVLIAGSGGTGATAAAVAKTLGAAWVYRMSRTGRGGALTYEDAYTRYSGAEILINTTPCGMFPRSDETPVALERLPGLEAVADVIYNPLTTALVQRARARGLKAENGLYMLVAQAVLAAGVFLEETVSPDRIEPIYREILREKQNIVLIGMPSAGKTTVGTLLAARLNRELRDTDAEIVKSAGMPVPEFFSRFGEARFRALETETVKLLSRTGGQVIATGGGAVLRRENVDALKQNGVVVFLDRPLSELFPTEDRPLSNDREKLRALYETRRPIYAAAADITLPVSGTPEDTAALILEKLR